MSAAQGTLPLAPPERSADGFPPAAARPRIIALVDANSFYASCEKAMNPALKGRPVVVLSNNDGCAIARSPEAKALGIAMGDPWFRMREACRRHGVHVVSSNYALYGDFSRRINAVYRQFTPEVETYSIDESFLDLTATPFPGGLRIGFAQDIRRTVFQCTGIPTCVGLAPTKTLAKLANRIAKQNPRLDGVCDLTEQRARDAWLPLVPLADVWGIGSAKAERLHGLGLRTAADLRDMDRAHARQALTVVGERTVRELQGVACLDLELAPARRKGLAVTRSFGRRVTALAEAEQAVAHFAARAAEKLREEGLLAPSLVVFMHTSRHETPRHGGSATVTFPHPTDDGIEIARAARTAVGRIHRPGFRYAKAGVSMDGLLAPGEVTAPLFASGEAPRRSRLMAAMDAVNRRYGRGTLHLASQGIERPWATRFDRLSGASTTRLAGLPLIGAVAGDVPAGPTWTLAEVAGMPLPAAPPLPPVPQPVAPAPASPPSRPAGAPPDAPLLRTDAPLTALGRRILDALRDGRPRRKSQVAALVGVGRGSAIRMVARLAGEGHLVETTPGWFTPAAVSAGALAPADTGAEAGP